MGLLAKFEIRNFMLNMYTNIGLNHIYDNHWEKLYDSESLGWFVGFIKNDTI